METNGDMKVEGEIILGEEKSRYVRYFSRCDGDELPKPKNYRLSVSTDGWDENRFCNPKYFETTAISIIKAIPMTSDEYKQGLNLPSTYQVITTTVGINLLMRIVILS
jgi:hypothetical protein